MNLITLDIQRNDEEGKKQNLMLADFKSLSSFPSFS